MKLASKIFIFISIFLTLILFIVNLATGISWDDLIYFITVIIVWIVGVLSLLKLENSTRREELTTYGILTLLFCNIISGALMLAMSDDDLSKEKKNEKVEPVRVVEIRKQTDMIVICLLILMFLSLTFSFAPILKYEGLVFYCLMLNIILVGLIVTISILYFVNRKRHHKAIDVFLFIWICIFVIVLILQIIASAKSYRDWIYIIDLVSTYTYSQGWYYVPQAAYSVAWEYMIVLSCSVIMIVLAVYLFIISEVKRFEIEKAGLFDRIIEQSETDEDNDVGMLTSVNVEEVRVVSEKKKVAKKETKSEELKDIVSFEKELEKIKKMFESELISQEEYEKIRASIIGKYYN